MRGFMCEDVVDVLLLLLLLLLALFAVVVGLGFMIEEIIFVARLVGVALVVDDFVVFVLVDVFDGEVLDVIDTFDVCVFVVGNDFDRLLVARNLAVVLFELTCLDTLDFDA